MRSIGGVPIYVDEFLPKTKWKQVKFPRSKKARIRKKWQKDRSNWKEVDCSMDVFIVDKRLFVRPEVMQILSGVIPRL